MRFTIARIRINRPVEEIAQQILGLFTGKSASEQQDMTEAIRQIRKKIYQRARAYWKATGDEARLALTDEALDEQFWLLDHEGVPRLQSDQGAVELPPDPLETMLKCAEDAALPFYDHNIAERSRDILHAEFAEYLLRRIR